MLPATGAPGKRVFIRTSRLTVDAWEMAMKGWCRAEGLRVFLLNSKSLASDCRGDKTISLNKILMTLYQMAKLQTK